MFWFVFGIGVLLFFGFEVWAMCSSSKSREVAWAEANAKDQEAHG